MRLTRCYVPEPLQAGDTRLLPEGVSIHIGRVLRAKAGDLLTLFDGRGGEYEAQVLALERRAVRVQIQTHCSVERESPLRVTLLQSLVRGDRMDLIVQKATELGVTSIVALHTEHSVVRLDKTGLQKRCDHWRAVAISACEQCGRNQVPLIDAVPDLLSACSHSATTGQKLLLTPEARHTLLELSAQAPQVSLLIGPEGGFADSERALSQQHGFRLCRLGPRVMRVETVPLAALAALQGAAGDFAL